MARIIITTTKEEQTAVLAVLKKIEGETTPVSAIARAAKLNQSRTRYVLVDLEESGKIRKIPTRTFNKHYIRYKYEVIGG